MPEHDTLAKRLGLILTRLNSGERLKLSTLAEEFSVAERTLQRDFNERLNYLPIERDGSTYYLNPIYLGRQGKSDIKPILDMLGLSAIFPSFDALSFTRLTDKQRPPFLFQDMKVEDVSEYTETFKSLTLAVQNQQLVTFRYKQQTYNFAQPYRLVNDRGCWYLATVHNGNLKSFKVAKVSHVDIATEKFERKASVDEQIVNGHMLWLAESPVEVVLRIDASIASHFRANTLLPEQQILKVLDDGCLLVTSLITDKKQILPVLKYWLPDVEILTPNELKQALLYDLQFSIDQLSS